MARTADPNWPKQYSTLLNVMLSVQNGVDDQEPLISAQGQAGHRSMGGKQNILISSPGFYISQILLLFPPLNECMSVWY